MGNYVQYGCGLSAPAEWINFDVSPTLRIQKIPILGGLLKGRLNTRFPDNVRYGDIIKGLPVADNSCDGLYCSRWKIFAKRCRTPTGFLNPAEYFVVYCPIWN
jgi:hypothetical protein